MGWVNRPHALCRGRCGWRAARACTSCQLDTPLPSRLFLRAQARADARVGYPACTHADANEGFVCLPMSFCTYWQRLTDVGMVGKGSTCFCYDSPAPEG